MNGKLLVAFALAAVLAALLSGLYVLWRGGAVAATWSNRLMRLRVLLQFIAVVIIMTVLYFSHR
ncbi:MAG: twin transmembrane helix small protein [Rhizomicrobium sp.]